MLRIENLTKIYGEHKAVDDLSLHIAPGEIYITARAKPPRSNPWREYCALTRGKYS